VHPEETSPLPPPGAVADRRAANFLNFLKSVGVPAVPTQMTFGISRDGGLFEWAGTGLDAVFCQRKNLLSRRMWRMLFDVVRFNQFALDLLIHEPRLGMAQETIGEYLVREGYSDGFRDDYLMPMTAAVWSTDPDKCALEFPATTLVRFLYESPPRPARFSRCLHGFRWNHHLLSTVARRPDWLTIPTGSQSYIDAVLRHVPPDHVLLNSPVHSVCNEPDGRVRIQMDGGRSAVYDHVIIATHGDQAYSLVEASATPDETAILSQFQTSENTAVLHSDLSLMPVSRKAWSSWNYLMLSPGVAGAEGAGRVSLTYNMNILQHIPEGTFGDVLVTLNPLHEPDADTVQGRYTYRHPLYNAAAVAAQNLLPSIQNTRGISYAGAWTKYGFHEDGFSSGLECARDYLGASPPLDFVDSTFSRGRRPVLGLTDWLLRVVILLIQTFVVKLAGGVEAAARRVRSVRKDKGA